MPVVIEPWRHEYRDFAMTLGQAKPIYCDTMAIEIETVIFAVLARPKLRLTRDIARKQGIAFLTRIAIDSRSYRMLQNFLIFYSFSVFVYFIYDQGRFVDYFRICLFNCTYLQEYSVSVSSENSEN